jgi:hypothetical protein
MGMSDNIHLKELWDRQETAIPDTTELIGKANKFKKQNLRKLIIANTLLLLTTGFIIFIWYHFQPKMITTKVGIMMVILAMGLYLLIYNQTIPLLMKINYEKSSNEYLQDLLKLKEKQLFLHNAFLKIYFILLSTGICLYMFEYSSRMTLGWAAFAYGLTLLWLAVNWFWFRPRTIKKQLEKINDLIRKFERVGEQFTQQ